MSRASTPLTLATALIGALIITVGPASRPAQATLPGSLTIQVVPKLEGVLFSLDGVTFASDANGVAETSVAVAGTHTLELVDSTPRVRGIRARFARWSDDVFTPAREVFVGTDSFLQVGFDLRYLVGQSFVDSKCDPIDPSRIGSLTLANSQGDRYTFPDGQPRWLHAARVIRRGDSLTKRQIPYSMQAVMVDGSNVVNRGQQRFLPELRGTWRIQLLFFRVQVQVKDAFLGFPIGSQLSLRYPDGHVERYDLDSDARVDLQLLPRGEYEVAPHGFGVSPSSPMIISRDQEAEIDFLSYYDLALVFFVLVSFALGVLFIGRPHLLRRLRHPIRFRAAL